MPSVSVIVPVYNAEKTLVRCVKSLLFGKERNLEILLIDDCSKDGSWELCQNLAEAYANVRAFQNEINRGVSYTRNRGLDEAVGEYILFVDSDDYVSEDYVSQLCAQHSDLTICGLEVQDEHGNSLYSIEYTKVIHERRNEINYTRLYKENALYSPYCKLFLNRIIQSYGLRFPQNVNWGEDGMFVADYLQYVESMAVIEYVGYHYVKYDLGNTLSTKVREDIVEMIDQSRTYCVDKMLSTSPEHFAAVKVVCTEDARWNIVCFIRRLFENTTFDKYGKIKVLKKFMQNRHVADILSNVNFYFAGSTAYQVALAKNNADAIVESFLFEVRKQRILEWLYRIYEILPESIKAVYRYVKKG